MKHAADVFLHIPKRSVFMHDVHVSCITKRQINGDLRGFFLLALAEVVMRREQLRPQIVRDVTKVCSQDHLEVPFAHRGTARHLLHEEVA